MNRSAQAAKAGPHALKRVLPPPYVTDRRVLEREVQIDTYRARGPGGQHRNVTESAVRLRHLPSGVCVVAADFRSQYRNRELAFQRLIRRLERLNRPPKPRMATKRTRKSIERRLVAKKHRQSTKKSRGRVKNTE